MNKEEKLISIVNSYSRKIFPQTNPDKALFEYERFCTELIEENKQLKERIYEAERRNNELEQDGQDIAKELSIRIDKAIELEEEIMYLANKVAITTQNIEVKAVRDRLEDIFKILKGE